MSEQERQRYTVGEVRVPFEERTAARELGLEDDDRGFRDLMGANDDDPLHPLGSDVAYELWLTPDEAEVFAAQDHARYVEPEEIAYPHYSQSALAAGIPNDSTRAYRRLFPADTGIWHGTDVPVAVLDSGTTAAIRAVMGWTLLGRQAFGDALPAGQELFPNAAAATGYYDHGCLVAPNCVPVSGRFYDYIVVNSSGLSNAANFLAAVKAGCDAGVKLFNYSYGSDPTANQTLSQTYVDAFTYLTNNNAYVFISMGNDSTAGMGSPAFASKTYSCVLSVTNFDEDTDARWSSSNYDAAATMSSPGGQVVSMTPDATTKLWNGTSAASPLACELAVRLCTNGVYTAAQAVTALKSTLRDSGQPAAQQGGGVVDFSAARDYLQGSVALTGVATPTIVASTGVAPAGGIGQLNVTVPAATQTDDALVVIMTASANAVLVAPEGWKLLRTQANSVHQVSVWARVWAPGDATRHTFTTSMINSTWISGLQLVVLRSTGGLDIDRISPLVRFGTDATPTSTQALARTSNTLLLECFALRDTDPVNGTLSVPPGTTSVLSTKATTNTNSLVGYKMLLTSLVAAQGRIAGYTSTSNVSGSWITVALAVSPAPVPVTPPVTTRRNLAAYSSPITTATASLNSSTVRFVRSGCSSSIAIGSAGRSVSIAGPAAGPINPGYWFTNFTGDGTQVANTSDLDVNLPPFLTNSVIGGQTYTLSLWAIYGSSIQAQSLIYVNWLNASGTSISTFTGTKQNIGTNASSWGRISQQVTAPANAVNATVQMWTYNLTSTSLGAFRWIGALYELGTTLGTFFDGDYPQGYWEGVNQVSSSSMFLDGSGRPFDFAAGLIAA